MHLLLELGGVKLMEMNTVTAYCEVIFVFGPLTQKESIRRCLHFLSLDELGNNDYNNKKV